MTIASEITRIQGAKSDIRQAIIDKGVSVSADLTIDDYACCINDIPTGGDISLVDVMVVGGGGGGGHASGYSPGGGGGAGGFIECCGYELLDTNYSIVVGQGGLANNCYNCYNGSNGGDSCFDNIVAYGGGGGGGGGCCFPDCNTGKNGGSGGGAGFNYRYSTIYQGGAGCSGQGYKGGDKGANCKYGGYCGAYRGGGGGGAGGPGCDGSTNCVSGAFPDGNWHFGGMGGIGIQSDISGTMQWYAGGGSASGDCDGKCRTSANCGGTSSANNDQDATICGAGGGGVYSTNCSNKTGKGGNGLFILRYKTACGYSITGGNCYICGDYTIHCFTSDGTLTVN